ncbi:McrC family protein [Priestia megaterium]|uniref:McrC family protein n=1 Tax=Priestia megaterium TaxID=1404 RepID=A0A6H1P4L2_PRIMG|nr:McrC family protein [Priestia megaterium]QIZ08499.1 McrC family protein [Priestia megaterium]
MLSTLSVREYEPIIIGNRFSKQEKIITRQQANLIEKFEIKQGKSIFKWGSNKVTPQQWVGVFGTSDFQIEVLPKLSLDNIENIRRNLIYMLTVAKEVPLRVQDIGRMDTTKAPILECFIRIFIDKLSNAIKTGILHEYRVIEENAFFLKGKLIVPHQIRKNLLNRNRFYVSYDEFTSNNILNRILKATIVKLIKYSSSSQNIKILNSLSTYFENINELEFSVTDLNKTQLPRTASKCYKEIFEMCKVFWKDEIPNLQGGSSQLFGILFDMNVLYEKFVQNLLIGNRELLFEGREFKTNQLQNYRYLLRDQNEHGAFKLKPDICIMNKGSGEVDSIIDTKWKILNSNKKNLGISQNDVYQMYAYAREYKCGKVTLLYPQNEEIPFTMPIYSNKNYIHNSIEVRVKTLNLNYKLPHEIDLILEQLKQVVEG